MVEKNSQVCRAGEPSAIKTQGLQGLKQRGEKSALLPFIFIGQAARKREGRSTLEAWLIDN